MSARCTIRQYAHGLKLESPFVPSYSTDYWDVRAKIRQNGRLGGRRGETGSRNMAATQKNRNSVGDFLYALHSNFSSILTRFSTVGYPSNSWVFFCSAVGYYFIALSNLGLLMSILYHLSDNAPDKLHTGCMYLDHNRKNNA